MAKAFIPVGRKFGRWTVIAERLGKRCWCVCDCGKRKNVLISSLLRAASTSCGCFALQQRLEVVRTHGKCKSIEYRKWASMKKRCYVRSNISFPFYGERGVVVCERWRWSFENFFSDMGKCPDGYSLDRIDSNGNYEPGNCRWSSRREQDRNRTNSHYLELDGVKLCISDWATKIGIHRSVLIRRLSRGWSVEETLKTPAIMTGRKVCTKLSITS